jgi:dolichol-phosphate mannosyltransferase
MTATDQRRRPDRSPPFECGPTVTATNPTGSGDNRTGTAGGRRGARPVAWSAVSALVVLPTYQEAANIPVVLRRLRAVTSDVDVLVVDDGSPDGTADIAEQLDAELGGIAVLRRTEKRGLGDAYRAGFAWGVARGYGALIEMDADLSHDPAAVPALLAGLVEADLVIGSRYIPGGSIPAWAWHRRLLSRAGNRYSSIVLGLPVTDLTSGFRAYRADILGKVRLDAVSADGYGFQIEMAYRVSGAGGRIIEVPIRFVDRTEGQSKMSLRITLEALALVTTWGVERLVRGLTGRGTTGR